MENILGVALALAATLLLFAIILSYHRRRALLSFLVGVTAGLFAVQIAQVHVFTIAVVVWAVLAENRGPRGLTRQAILLVACALPLAVTALTGDLVNSPTLALQLLALAASAAILVVNSTPSDARQMLYGLLAACTVGCIAAVLQVAGLVPVNEGTLHLSVSSIGRPTGTYPEPDWLGMYAAVGLILAWRLPLRPSMRIAIIAVETFALAFSFARAAWVALAVAVAVGAVLAAIDHRRVSASRKSDARARSVRSGRKTAVVFVVIAGSIALTLIPALANDLGARLSKTLIADPNDVSAQARVQQNDGLNYLASTAPWYGHGISAAGRVGVSGILEYGDSQNNVGSNWLLSLWVDGQLLALPLIALFLVMATRSAKRIEGQILIVVLISSLFSNATYQPIAWFLIALCFIGSRVRGQPSSRISAHGPSEGSQGIGLSPKVVLGSSGLAEPRAL